MTVSHNENAFEAAIEHSLLSAGGYRKGNPADFAAPLGLTPSLVVEFLFTFALAWVVIALMLFVGVRKFRQTERTFADMV